jgi:hypothetical protein
MRGCWLMRLVSGLHWKRAPVRKGSGPTRYSSNGEIEQLHSSNDALLNCAGFKSLGISPQKPSSESSSSSRIVCPIRPSPSLRFPTSFSNHSAYFVSTNGSALNFASPLDDELCHASSSFFCSRAARTEAADLPVSPGVGVKLKRDIRTVEDR